MGQLIALAFEFAVTAIVGAAFLWVGMRITARLAGMVPGAAYCRFRELVAVSALAAAAGLVPHVGWILSVVTLFVALRKVTEADAWELIVMVIIARTAAVAAFFVVMAL